MQFGLHYPTRNEVVEFRSSLHPEIKTCELKCSVDLDALMINTLKGLFELIPDHDQTDRDADDDTLMYELMSKFGADGSGSHKVRHQNINR